MNTCRCTGSVPFTISESEELSVGTERQPSSSRPSSLTIARPHALAVGAQALVARHEDVADGVAAGRRQVEAELLALLLEEVVRDLNEHAGAVAGQRVGAHGAAVLEIGENLQRVGNDLMRLAALQVGDEADAARIVLVRRVVKPLRSGRLEAFERVGFAHVLALRHTATSVRDAAACFCSNRTGRRSHESPIDRPQVALVKNVRTKQSGLAALAAAVRLRCASPLAGWPTGRIWPNLACSCRSWLRPGCAPRRPRLRS